MKKNTALVELIEWYKNESVLLGEHGDFVTPSQIISKATELLSKEREDIENAYWTGKCHESGTISEIEMKPSEYFDDTFNQ